MQHHVATTKQILGQPIALTLPHKLDHREQIAAAQERFADLEECYGVYCDCSKRGTLKPMGEYLRKEIAKVGIVLDTLRGMEGISFDRGFPKLKPHDGDAPL